LPGRTESFTFVPLASHYLPLASWAFRLQTTSGDGKIAEVDRWVGPSAGTGIGYTAAALYCFFQAIDLLDRLQLEAQRTRCDRHAKPIVGPVSRQLEWTVCSAAALGATTVVQQY
jgi:hypothetical protein